ncbi:MAG: hypothetical protein IPK32_17695 [Verrucomicrobiaceae bacterium]|nr:hypothetical protein [Verrucomicrobiaceae bacterium]
MILYKPQTDAELQNSLDDALASVKADIDSQVEPGFPVAMAASVQIHHQVTLPILGPRIWLLAPRAWVGVVGFVCCLTIAGLWIFSSFVSSIAVSGGYGRSGMDEASSHGASPGQIIIDESSVPESRAIYLDDQK